MVYWPAVGNETVGEIVVVATIALAAAADFTKEAPLSITPPLSTVIVTGVFLATFTTLGAETT